MTANRIVARRLFLIMACCWTGAASAGWTTENWPGYRGPTKQGHVPSSALPIRWSESENVTWKTPVPGKAWSSPIVWNDWVFVTNATEDGSRLSIVCLDKNSGEVVYDKLLHEESAPQYCHPFNSYASPSPVVEAGRLYVSFGSPYNACLDPGTGKVLWQRTDFVCNHFRGPGSSPCIFGDKLLLHFDGSDHQYAVALNKETGETIWRTDRSVDYQDIDPATGKPDRDGDWRKAYSTPLIIDVDGRPLMVSVGSKAVYAYEPETGEEVWRVNMPDNHSCACRPVYGHGLVFIAAGAGNADFWAIRPDGRGDVTDTHVAWHYDRAVPKRSSILLVGDLLYMVDNDGVAACLDAKSGKEVWKRRLGGNFSASLIYADGKIYCFDQQGQTTVLRAGRNYEKLAENQLGDGFMASPAVSGNALFVRSRSHVYRVQAGR